MTTVSQSSITDSNQIQKSEVRPSLLGNVLCSTLLGYGYYYAIKISIKFELVNHNGSIHPLPYVLFGLISSTLQYTSTTIYRISKDIFDKNDNQSKNIYRSIHSLHNKMEKIGNKIDITVSNFFQIRTQQEIYDKKTPQNELSLIEFTRDSIIKSSSNLITTICIQNLTLYILQRTGYSNVFGLGISTQNIICFHAVKLTLNLADKIISTALDALMKEEGK